MKPKTGSLRKIIKIDKNSSQSNQEGKKERINKILTSEMRDDSTDSNKDNEGIL